MLAQLRGVDRHQNDDLAPYIYKTADYGATWSRITAGIPDGSFFGCTRRSETQGSALCRHRARRLRLLRRRCALALAANQFTDRAGHDLVVKNDDLVLATHGRAFWILDDVSPLRQFADSVVAEDVHLYHLQTAYRVHAGDAPEHLTFDGKNPPHGAVIYYYFKKAPKPEAKPGEVTIEILDASGTVVRKFSSNKTEPLEEPLDPDDKKPEKQIKPEDGLNRFVWDLRYDEANRVPGYFLWEYNEGAKGPLALPGNYQCA